MLGRWIRLGPIHRESKPKHEKLTSHEAGFFRALTPFELIGMFGFGPGSL